MQTLSMLSKRHHLGEILDYLKNDDTTCKISFIYPAKPSNRPSDIHIEFYDKNNQEVLLKEYSFRSTHEFYHNEYQELLEIISPLLDEQNDDQIVFIQGDGILTYDRYQQDINQEEYPEVFISIQDMFQKRYQKYHNYLENVINTIAEREVENYQKDLSDIKKGDS